MPLATRPLPKKIGELVQDFAELSYIQGQQMERTLLRIQLGLSIGEKEEEASRLAIKDRVSAKRDQLVDAIRELL